MQCSPFLDFLTIAVETDILSWNVGVTTIGCIILKKSAHLTWWFGNGDTGLAQHCPVQCNTVSHIINILRMTPHIEVPKFRKNLVLHLSKYALCSYESLFWWIWRTADWHQCHSSVPALWAMWHNKLQTHISATVQCLLEKNVVQWTAGWHQCHSSVPVLRAVWHNELQAHISATVQCLPFEQCGTINCRLTSVPQLSACLRTMWHN